MGNVGDEREALLRFSDSFCDGLLQGAFTGIVLFRVLLLDETFPSQFFRSLHGVHGFGLYDSKSGSLRPGENKDR
jgi:hypothetical protein